MGGWVDGGWVSGDNGWVGLVVEFSSSLISLCILAANGFFFVVTGCTYEWWWRAMLCMVVGLSLVVFVYVEGLYFVFFIFMVFFNVILILVYIILMYRIEEWKM